MNPRERLTATINHHTPDRLCVDIGAGGQTGMGVLAVHSLRRKIINDPHFRVKVIEPYQMLGEIDLEMIRSLQLDVAGIPGPGTLFGFRNKDWKPFVMNDGTEVLVPGKFNYKIIFMLRKMEQILASQKQMLIRRGRFRICSNFLLL